MIPFPSVISDMSLGRHASSDKTRRDCFSRFSRVVSGHSRPSCRSTQNCRIVELVGHNRGPEWLETFQHARKAYRNNPRSKARVTRDRRMHRSLLSSYRTDQLTLDLAGPRVEFHPRKLQGCFPPSLPSVRVDWPLRPAKLTRTCPSSVPRTNGQARMTCVMGGDCLSLFLVKVVRGEGRRRERQHAQGKVH